MLIATVVSASATSALFGSPESMRPVECTAFLTAGSWMVCDLDRKVLADLALNDPHGFAQIVELARRGA